MSSDKLALLKNVDPLTGAGVGYSYQLFIYENFLIGSLLLGIVILFNSFFKRYSIFNDSIRVVFFNDAKQYLLLGWNFYETYSINLFSFILLLLF